MKLQQIFDLKPIRTSNDFYGVKDALSSIYNEHGRKSTLATMLDNFDIDSDKYTEIENEKRVEVRTYMQEGDDKWGAILYSVYFDNEPCMLVKNDGRYFSDHDCYLANNGVYEKLEKYVLSKMDYESTPQKYNLDEDIADLQVVNQYDLNNHYSKDLKPQYKIGDEVWAWVKENHLKESYSPDYKGYILTKVEVHRISEFDPINTYWGVQCERGWNQEIPHTMVLNSDRISKVGTQFSDEVIIGKVSEIPIPRFAINNFVDSRGVVNPDYQVTLDDLIEILSKPESSKIKAKIK